MVESEFRRRLVTLLPRLMRFALALTRSRPDAEDLTQATCERALARMEQWEVDTKFDSWMFRIMHTIWLNNLRSRNVRARHHAALAAAEAAPAVPAAEGRLMLAKVAEKVLDLPAEQRLVLMLVTVEGFSYREAAAIADVPIGTVMSRLARARLGLMKAIGEAEDGLADNVVRMGSK
ncbi:MAG: RNA polymerase sigma factor [Acetobacteraceae bacterium]